MNVIKFLCKYFSGLAKKCFTEAIECFAKKLFESIVKPIKTWFVNKFLSFAANLFLSPT